MITDGLKLYLPFYSVDLQGSPIISKDENHFSCTLSNNPTWGTQGRILNGTNQNIIIPSASNLITGTGDWTVSVWIKPNTLPATSCFGLQFASTTYENIYLMAGLVGTIHCRAYGGAGGANPYLVPDVADAIVDGVWQKFTLTKVGNLYTLYKNAVPIASDTQVVDFGTPISNYFIGSNRFPAQWFKGTIGEFIIHNRGLSATEVSNLYLETLKTYKACWDFFTWA